MGHNHSNRDYLRARSSQLLSVILLLRAAMRYYPKALYYSFISAADYALARPEQILEFLRNRYPDNFIGLTPVEKLADHFRERFTIMWMPDRHVLTRIVNRCFANEIPALNWTHGNQWFTITNQATFRLMKELDGNPDLLAFYDYVKSPVESLFQTLYRMSGMPTAYFYLRYINWTGKQVGRGHPRTLTIHDYDDIVSNQCNFWVRKLHMDIDEDLYDRIDEYRMSQNVAQECDTRWQYIM